MTTTSFTKGTKLVIFLFPAFFLCFAFALKFLNNPLYQTLFGILEGGLFEWVQFICYGIASWISLKTFVTIKNSDLKLQKYVILIFSLGCALIALEEISWGQHIFKWVSPDWFSNSNLQKETNLHNLAAIQGNALIGQLSLYSILVSFVLWYGSLAWLLRFQCNTLSIRDLVLPQWFVSSYFSLVVLAGFQTKIFNRAYTDYTDQEVFETIISFGFLAVSLVNRIKVQSKLSMRIKPTSQ
jgi:hypothetical protein